MTPFLGQIMMFGGNFAPRGWALCDGQLLPISQYSALFSILGTTYGGDGVTTFGLPDLRGRLPMHAGHGPGLSSRTLGAKGGVEGVQGGSTPVGGVPGHEQPIAPGFAAPGSAGSTGGSGGGELQILPPHQVVNFCIALEGIYPSRS